MRDTLGTCRVRGRINIELEEQARDEQESSISFPDRTLETAKDYYANTTSKTWNSPFTEIEAEAHSFVTNHLLSFQSLPYTTADRLSHHSFFRPQATVPFRLACPLYE